jgi:hypothetical protein
VIPADLPDGDESQLDLGRLLAWLDETVHAIDARDRLSVSQLLGRAESVFVPTAIREELMHFAVGEAEGFRPPLRFLRFRYRMMQLAAGDKPIEEAPQLELEFRRGRSAPGDRAARGRMDDDLGAPR